MNLQELGQDIIKKIKVKGPYEAEIYLTNEKHTSISVLEQKIEEVKTSEEQGLSIRLIHNDKMGFAYTSDLSTEAIDDCINKTIDNNSHNTKDTNWEIAHPKESSKADLGIFDRTLADTHLKDKIAIPMEIEREAKAQDPRVTKTDSINYFDTISSVYLLNTKGIDLGYSSTYCGGMADMIAEDKKTMESGSGMDFKVHLKDLEQKNIGKEAALNACQMLGAKTPATQKCDLILSPEVAIQFLAVLSALFRSSNTQKGKSFLADKLEQQVASKILTITDNGSLPNQIGSAPFDDEGTPSQRTDLLQNGVLRNYLYNIYTANRGRTVSTGNASRSSYFSLPEIAPTNLYIEPGQKSETALVEKTSKGIYVTKAMGMHTADPISGDFSIGIAGLQIEKGKKSAPVRGGAIAGNLKDLLNSVQDIGDNLRFLPFGGNLGSPALLISGMSVSGS